MSKIRKGDEVVVIAGRDKGRRGTVVSVLEGHVVVEAQDHGVRAGPQAGVGVELDVLREDGRISIAELGARIGLSKTPCQIRFRRLV